MDIGFHDRVNRGQLLSRVTNDLFQIQSLVASAPAFIGNLAAVCVVAVILMIVSPLLGAVALVLFPLVVVTSRRYSAAVRPALGSLQRERGQLAGVVEEGISGIRAVKGFGAEPLLERRLGEQADAVRREALGVVVLRAHYSPYLNVIPLIELVAINWIGAWLVLGHHITIGLLLAFNTYLVLLTGPLQSMGWFVVQLQRALVSSRRIESIMDLRPAIADPRVAASLAAGSWHGPLRVRHVQLSPRHAASHRRVITESCGSPISRRARRTLQVDTNQRVRWRVAGGEGYANAQASP